MRFKEKEPVTYLNTLIMKTGAVLSGVEYGALVHMSLCDEELDLIFHYERVKQDMIEKRREQEDFNRELKRERERELRNN